MYTYLTIVGSLFGFSPSIGTRGNEYQNTTYHELELAGLNSCRGQTEVEPRRSFIARVRDGMVQAVLMT